MIDIKILRKTPKKYSKTLTKNQLIKVIRKARTMYFDYHEDWISDIVYDVCCDRLQDVDPENSLLCSGKVTKIDKIEKSKLIYPMPSLNKVKPDGGCSKWLKNNKGPYVVTDKLDGISLQIIGEDNKLFTKGSTGGGLYGKDISHLFKGLILPQSELDIRSEVIISTSTFEKYYSSKFSNARNFVGRITTKINISERDLSSLTVICYELLNSDLRPSNQLELLKKEGFTIPKYRVFHELDEEKLSKYLEQRKKKSYYEIDGLVVSVNKPYKRTIKNPKYSMAFKFQDLDKAVDIKVNEIEWGLSKQNNFKPVACFDPVEIGGVIVRRVTLNNGFYVKHGYGYKDRKKKSELRPIGKGSVLRVIRSGEVIPYVVKVVKASIKDQWPKATFYWTENGVEIYSKDKSAVVDVKLITSFFKIIGVEDFSEGLIAVLYKEGYNSIDKIVKLEAKDILHIKGIKERNADKIVSGIKLALNPISIHKLMSGSECFKGMKEERLKLITDAYPKIYRNEDVVTKVEDIKGFSKILAKRFSNGLPSFRKFLKSISGYYNIAKPKTIKSNPKLVNQIICFTGFREPSLKLKVETGGGKVTNSISSKTDLLIIKNESQTSTKIDKARNLGVKVITKTEFKDNYFG